MAVLTSADLTAYKRAIRRDPIAKAELRALSPSKADWTAAMQGLEDWFEAERPNIKVAMQTASGLTLSNALAKKLARVWMERKFGGE